MSISRGMNKEDVELIYNGILLSHLKKKKKKPFAATWMDLKVVILSEVRKRQISCDITLYVNLKNGAMNLFI